MNMNKPGKPKTTACAPANTSGDDMPRRGNGSLLPKRYAAEGDFEPGPMDAQMIPTMKEMISQVFREFKMKVSGQQQFHKEIESTEMQIESLEAELAELREDAERLKEKTKPILALMAKDLTVQWGTGTSVFLNLKRGDEVVILDASHDALNQPYYMIAPIDEKSYHPIRVNWDEIEPWYPPATAESLFENE